MYTKTLIPNSYSRQLFYSTNGVTVSTHSSDTGIWYFIFNEYGQVLNILVITSVSPALEIIGLFSVHLL